MADWKFSRRRGACAACDRSFEDGERHVSTLRVTPEGLERGDVCRAWWDATPASARGDECRRACQERAEESEGGPTAGEDVFWWGTRHFAEQKRTVQLDLESLERLFLQLEGTDELRLQELRYVLCLILMRKRRLKVERVLRTADGEAFRVKRPRRDERLEVRVFDFSPERMAEIRTELQAIFDGAEAVEGVELADTPVEEPAAEADSSAEAAPDAVEPSPVEPSPVEPSSAGEGC